MNIVMGQFLTVVLVYGYPIIGLAIFLSSVGFPFPATIITVSAGSLAAIGDLNIVILFFVVVLHKFSTCSIFQTAHAQSLFPAN